MTLGQKFAEKRIDNRHKAGWDVVSSMERIGYILIHYQKSETNDFDIIFSPTGVGKIDSHDPEEFMKKIAEDIETNGIIQPTFVLPQVKTGGEKLLRGVAITVIEKYFGSHNVRIDSL
jgi:hypothetical protein